MPSDLGLGLPRHHPDSPGSPVIKQLPYWDGDAEPSSPRPDPVASRATSATLGADRVAPDVDPVAVRTFPVPAQTNPAAEQTHHGAVQTGSVAEQSRPVSSRTNGIAPQIDLVAPQINRINATLAHHSRSLTPHSSRSEAEGELRFHSKFTTPATATILQASDGTCFRFEVGALAVASSVFADMKSLRTTIRDDGMLVHLPSATRSALHFALSYIKTTLRCEPPADFDIDEDMCDDILLFANVYDFPVLFSVLYKAIEGVKRIQPTTRLVIAIFARDKKAVADLTLPSLKDHCGYRTKLVNAMRAREPDAFIPHTLAALLNHRSRWTTALNAFEDEAVHQARQTFVNVFNKECRLNNYMCEQYLKWGGKLSDFAAFEAGKCPRRILNNPQLLASKEAVYNPHTSCRKCDARLKRIIDDAIAETLRPSVYALNIPL